MSSKKRFLSALENWVNVYLYRSLTEFFNYLKVTGISMQQAYALTFIYYNGPSKISDICEHMMVTAAAASQMVDRLEKLNIVDRISKVGDRRVRNVVLSDDRIKFVQESIEARQSCVKEIPTELTEDQIEQVSAALHLLNSVYKEMPE